VETIGISVVIPVYNEAANIQPLYRELVSVLEQMRAPFEIVFVDDGSRDGSLQQLIQLHQYDRRVRVIAQRRNYGQTAALDAGIKHATHDLVVTMDADLQNDPQDIPRLLAKLNEGYDLVTGWRWKRRDPLLKSVLSRVAHMMRAWVIKEKVHDQGCTLKIFRKECFKEFTLYGEMHRYIPTLVSLKGFRVAELKVNHRARRAGKTKYSLWRVFRGFFDMLFIKFWADYSTRPLHFFGMVALLQFFLAGLIFIEQVIKAIIVRALEVGPLFILIVMLCITGLLTFLFGFLAEILIRAYYRDQPNYSIGKIYG
jgi:glycosyltransferase involved in cell wall biosynthesis